MVANRSSERGEKSDEGDEGCSKIRFHLGRGIFLEGDCAASGTHVE